MLDYNALATEYAQHRQIHPLVLQRLLATPGLDAKSHILEVGCGTGNYIRTIAQALGCACWGIDPSEQMLAQAKGCGGAISYEVGRAESLNTPSGFFDLVFSVDVIHHVTRRADYFNSAWRALKPGGQISTVTDSEWIIRNRQPLSEYFPATVEAELRRYPPIDVLRAEMTSAGFNQQCEESVELTYALTDCAAYRAKTYSALHLISQQEFDNGIAHMERDLQHSPIACASRYVLLWGVRPLNTSNI